MTERLFANLERNSTWQSKLRLATCTLNDLGVTFRSAIKIEFRSLTAMYNMFALTIMSETYNKAIKTHSIQVLYISLTN